jgi:hypothetical protein
MGRIFRVLDSPTDQTKEITDEQAAVVKSATDPLGYWVVDGVFIAGTEQQAKRKADAEAARFAAMTPEQRAAAAIYDQMPAGKRAMWEPVRTAVAKALMAGDFAHAKEILVTLPAIYPDAEAERQQFLTLFP